MPYILMSDNAGSVPLHVDTLEQAKSTLKALFGEDAALEGREVDPELIAQINGLTDIESGVELHGYGITETFLLRVE